MQKSIVFFAALTGLVACVEGNAPTDPRVAQIQSGELSTNNLIIYDNGSRMTFGMQVLGSSGNFELAGPTIVFVIQSLATGDPERMEADGINAEEYTAYLLPEGELLTLEALQRMQRIGPIDPKLSHEKIRAQFGIGDR